MYILRMEGSGDTPKSNKLRKLMEIFKKKPEESSASNNIVPITQNLTDKEVIERSWQVEQIMPEFQGTNIVNMPRARYGTNDNPQPPKGA